MNSISNIPECVFTSIAKSMSQSIDVDKIPVRVMDSHIVQLGKGQDLIYSSQHNDNEWILAVFDGHGINSGINPFTKKYGNYNLCIESLNCLIQECREEKNLLEVHLKKDIFDDFDNPAVSLQRELSKICLSNRSSFTSGATMSLVKINHECLRKKIVIDVLTVGDSPVIIHRNGENVFESIIHGWNNSDEHDRLEREGRFLYGDEKFAENHSFEILDEKHITYKSGYYFNTKHVRLAMSQALGHIEFDGKRVVDEKGTLGLNPCKARLEFDDTDEINIKVFSDGVSDVIVPSVISDDAEFMRTSNAHETVQRSMNRWKQDWKYCYKKTFVKNKDRSNIDHVIHNFESNNNMDDVSCICWIQTTRL